MGVVGDLIKQYKNELKKDFKGKLENYFQDLLEKTGLDRAYEFLKEYNLRNSKSIELKHVGSDSWAPEGSQKKTGLRVPKGWENGRYQTNKRGYIHGVDSVYETLEKTSEGLKINIARLRALDPTLEKGCIELEKQDDDSWAPPKKNYQDSGASM